MSAISVVSALVWLNQLQQLAEPASAAAWVRFNGMTAPSGRFPSLAPWPASICFNNSPQRGHFLALTQPRVFCGLGASRNHVGAVIVFAWSAAVFISDPLQQFPAAADGAGLDAVGHLSEAVILGLAGVAGKRLCFVRPVLAFIDAGAFGKGLGGALINGGQGRFLNRD